MPVATILAPPQAQERVTGDDLAVHACVLFVLVTGVALGLDALGQNAHQVLVVGIDKDDTVGSRGQVVIKFTLGAYYALQRAKALQVRLAHVGNQAAGGLGGFGQRLDVARVAGAHLDDGNLMHDAQAEQRLGHTHIVVEVALGRHLVIALGQDGAHEFLGRRLAVGAGDADDGDVETAAVFACHVLVGLQRVRDKNHLLVTGVVVVDLLVVDDGDGTALVQSLCGKLVAVKRFALQGDKYAALGALAAVGGDDRMLLVDCVKIFAVHNMKYYLWQNYKNNRFFI